MPSFCFDRKGGRDIQKISNASPVSPLDSLAAVALHSIPESRLFVFNPYPAFTYIVTAREIPDCCT
jgi:hypothetical protein